MKPFQSDGAFYPITTGKGLRRAAVRGAGTALAGQASSFVIGLGSVAVLARLLTPADFGIVTMVTTASLLFRSFGQNGFTELVVQHEDLTHSLAGNLFCVELGIGMLLTVLFAGSGPLLARFYHNAAVAHVAEAMSLTIGFGCVGWIHLGLLQRAMQFRTTAIINFIGQLVLVIVSIVSAVAGYHYWALVWGSIAQSVTVAAGAWLACRWIPSWPHGTAGTGKGVRFALNVYSHFAFSYLTRNVDNVLVGWKYGGRALGFYKRAYDLFVLPEQQLLSPMAAVVLSTLSRVNQDRGQFQRYFLRVISVLAFLGMGVGADFALVGKDIIRFLLGPGWEEAGHIFALFGPGIGVMLLYDTHGWIHLSIGRPERWIQWALVEFTCTASLFLLMLHWGPSGIAVAWTCSYFLLMIPGFWFAGKPIGLSVGAIVAVIWRFFFASVLAGAATALIVSVMPSFVMFDSAAAALARMTSVSLMFSGLYIGCIIVLHGGLKPVSETLGLLRDFLPETKLKLRQPVVANSEVS
jgi:O-antigen/teichoic acid export membrane protein